MDLATACESRQVWLLRPSNRQLNESNRDLTGHLQSGHLQPYDHLHLMLPSPSLPTQIKNKTKLNVINSEAKLCNQRRREDTKQKIWLKPFAISIVTELENSLRMKMNWGRGDRKNRCSHSQPRAHKSTGAMLVFLVSCGLKNSSQIWVKRISLTIHMHLALKFPSYNIHWQTMSAWIISSTRNFCPISKAIFQLSHSSYRYFCLSL